MSKLAIIGNASLYTSTVLYLMWFLPQLRLSHRRQSAAGLSLIAHCILLSGYLADLIYGLGRHMPTAYIIVTCVGLISLGYQNWQLRRFSNLNSHQRYALWLPFLIGALLSCALIALHQFNNIHVLDLIGLVSVCSGFLYSLPQLKKNHQQLHNQDLSIGFILIGLGCSALDITSAFCLNWDYPNKIGAPLALIFSLLLLHNQLHARKRWRACSNSPSS